MKKFVVISEQAFPADAGSAQYALVRRGGNRRAREPAPAYQDRVQACLAPGVEQIPWAALLAQVAGLAPRDHCLCLEPVIVEPRRETLILRPAEGELPAAQRVQLAREAAALIEPLGWQVAGVTEARIFLTRTGPVSLTTTPWWRVQGRDVSGYLPAGPDGRLWRGVFNDLQMALYAGLRPTSAGSVAPTGANALWPWGEGVATVAPRAQWQRVYGEDDYSRALAVWQGVPCASLAECEPEVATGATLVVDTVGLADTFFERVLAALRRGVWDEVRVWYADGGECRVTAWDLRKFWRR